LIPAILVSSLVLLGIILDDLLFIFNCSLEDQL
jgi:hypothetical protein